MVDDEREVFRVKPAHNPEVTGKTPSHFIAIK